MIRAVFDCGVLVSAIGWAGNPRSCLAMVVSNDRDLLDLGRPFGIAILTPIQFLKFVQESTRP
jgi:hypothetical protein